MNFHYELLGYKNQNLDRKNFKKLRCFVIKELDKLCKNMKHLKEKRVKIKNFEV